jgi:hypothetical protein
MQWPIFAPLQQTMLSPMKSAMPLLVSLEALEASQPVKSIQPTLSAMPFVS